MSTGYINGLILLVRFGLLVLMASLLTGCSGLHAERTPSSTIHIANDVVQFGNHTIDKTHYRCGGELEAAIWRLWENQGREFLRLQLIEERLIKQGDTYALYDIQIYFHNLVDLANRCRRSERMHEMADSLMPLLSKLERLPNNQSQRGWVCKGGLVCNHRNRLINSEVMLVSVQGLGLLSSLAQAMSSSSVRKVRNHVFVSEVAQVSSEHLLRWWVDANARANWLPSDRALPTDVKADSSALFFTDKSLWMITIYSNLAGIYAQEPSLYSALSSEQRQALSNAMRSALALFKARTTFRSVSTQTEKLSNEQNVIAASIDEGFWRLYPENRYAGYIGTLPPATCNKLSDGAIKPQLNVDPKDVPIVANLGWDFSHARRLVQALSALEINRNAIKHVYKLNTEDLHELYTEKAFAKQLVTYVWNGDLQVPLFSNYWSGANGWYRVAYDNGTGLCYAGYPPYSLSDAFAYGGYAAWAKHYPVIGEIAQSIYMLSKSQNQNDIQYIKKNIPSLALTNALHNRTYAQLMFWPTLIQ